MRAPLLLTALILAAPIGAGADPVRTPIAGTAPDTQPSVEVQTETIDDPSDASGWTAASPPAAASTPGAVPAEPATALRASALLRLALDTQHQGVRSSAEAGFHEDVMDLYGQAAAALSHRPRSWARLTLGGRLEYRLTAERPSAAGRRDYVFNGRLHRNDFAVVPGENFLELTKGPVDLLLGLATVVWGTSDLVNPNDVLTGRDLLGGPAIDPESARLPLPMVKIESYLRGFDLSVVWLPVTVPDRLDVFGSDFAVFGPAGPVRLRWIDQVARTVFDPSVDSLVEPALLQTRLPRPVKDSSLAVRAGRSVWGWDLALQYAFIHERQPVMRLHSSLVLAMLPLLGARIEQAQPVLDDETRATLGTLLLSQPFPIESTYRRQHQAGLSVSRSLWKILLTLDAAYTSRQAVLLGGTLPFHAEGPWLATSVDSQAIAYTVGTTYSRGDEWLLRLEWWHRILVDVARQAQPPTLLRSGPQLGGLALLARHSAPRLHVTTQVAVLSDLLNRSLILSAQVAYRAWDSLAVFGGGNFFEGAKESLGGSLHPNDQLFIGVQGFL